MGLGTKEDCYKAFECYQKAIEANEDNIVAWENLGWCYQYAIGIEKDKEKAFECFQKAKEIEKKEEAALRKGCYPYNTVIVKLDVDKIFQRYKKIVKVDVNNIDALLGLAECYAEGIGTEKNRNNAFKCFKKAVKVDEICAEAWSLLGFCYSCGIGTEEDEKKGNFCKKKAVELDKDSEIAWLALITTG